MVDLETKPIGIILPVRAQPGGKKNALTGEHAGQLKVSVTQVPEKGKANAAIIDHRGSGGRVGAEAVTDIAGLG